MRPPNPGYQAEGKRQPFHLLPRASALTWNRCPLSPGIAFRFTKELVFVFSRILLLSRQTFFLITEKKRLSINL